MKKSLLNAGKIGILTFFVKYSQLTMRIILFKKLHQLY